MDQVRPCDVISGPELAANLLVVETESQRLQAGLILRRGSQEIVTLPGTYLPRHLGKIAVIDSWEPERAAEALALGFFGEDVSLYNKFVDIWRSSLVQAQASNVPFNPNCSM